MVPTTRLPPPTYSPKVATTLPGSPVFKINFVEDTDNSKHMEWEDASGDLEQKILYLIKNRVDDDTYYITEKQKVENNEK
jgi:hypothetical protein